MWRGCSADPRAMSVSRCETGCVPKKTAVYILRLFNLVPSSWCPILLCLMPFRTCLWPAKPCQAPAAAQGDPHSSQYHQLPAGTATVAVICQGLVALAQPGPAGVQQLHEAVRTVQLTLASQSLFLSLMGADVIPSLAPFLQ